MKNGKDTHYCTFCQKDVTYHINTVDHKKEMVRSIFTCGLWLPIWLALAFSKTKICDVCNNALPEE